MPFIYDETQVEWPDDGTEPAPPRADQFVYMAASEFGGGRAPVRFDVPLLRPPVQAAAEPTRAKNGGFLYRLLGVPPPAAARPQTERDLQEKRESAQREWEQRWERIRAIVIPALQEIGGRRVYGRYDGGNDEGFAWFDSLELRDGQRIDPDAVAQRLQEAQVDARLLAAGVEPTSSRSRASDNPVAEALKHDVEICSKSRSASHVLSRSACTGTRRRVRAASNGRR